MCSRASLVTHCVKPVKTLAGLTSHDFCYDHLHGGVRVWHIIHVKKYFVSNIQAAGGGGWLTTTAYLRSVADHVRPSMTTGYLSSDACFQQDNTLCHNIKIISNWFLEHHNGPPLGSTVSRSQRFASWQSAATVQHYQVNMHQNLCGISAFC